MVVVQVTSGGHSGIFTHTVGQGVTVVVVLVVVPVDDVLVVVVVEVVEVTVVEVTVKVCVLEVAVNVCVCVVCVSGTTGWSPGPSEHSHINNRGTARLTQMHHGTQAQNQGIGLGTGTVSNWPPHPTYFHSLTCSHWPLPPPT
jgi:hypothetical protein